MTGGPGLPPPTTEKAEVALCFLRNTGKDPLEKQLREEEEGEEEEEEE